MTASAKNHRVCFSKYAGKRFSAGGFGSVQGVVTSEGGEPVVNAVLYLEPGNISSKSSADGSFLIKKVPARNYTLQVACLGYAKQSLPLVVEDGKTTTIDIVLQLEVTTLGDVTVIAEREEQTIQRLDPIVGTYLVEGVKNEVVELRQSESNVVQNYARSVFSKVPGVFVYEYDGSGNAVNISTRGLDPHRSWEFNIRMNDLMINSDLYGYPANHFNPPLEAVTRIQLIRGSSSLQYGAQFGGMLNFVLNTMDTAKPFSLHTQLSRGSYDFFSSFTEAGGKVGKWQYYAYYNHRTADTYRENADYTYDSWHLSSTYYFTPDLSVKAEVSHMNYLNHLPGALNDSMFHENPRQSTRARNYYSPVITVPGINLNWQVNRSLTVNLITSAVLGDRNSVQFLALATVPDTINAGTNDYNQRQVDIDNFNSYNAEIRGLYTYMAGRMQNTLTSGFRMINNDLHRRQQAKGTTGSDYDLTVEVPFRRDVHYKSVTYAFFAEHLIGFSSRFSVTPGVRIELGDSKLSGFISYYNETNVPQEIDHTFPLLGIRSEYKINESNNIYGGWSQAYRPMILKDIIPPTAQDVIDPNLKDATGWNAELGVRGSIGRWLDYDVSGFALEYDDRIGTLVLTDDTCATYFYKTNVGNSFTPGIEVFTEVTPLRRAAVPVWLKGISVFTSSSYMQARYVNGTVVSNGQNVNIDGNQVEAAPDWNVRGGLTYRNGDFRSTLLCSYTSSSYADALNTVTPNASGTLGLVPQYTLFDFDAVYYYKMFNFRFSIANLFNVRYFSKRPTFYPDPGIWPGEGQTVTFSMGLKI